jgi:hypothetical protein
MSAVDLSQTHSLSGAVGLDAANDSSGPASPDRSAGGRSSAAAAGWDPFEIWRTRVRDARRNAPRPANP